MNIRFARPGDVKEPRFNFVHIPDWLYNLVIIAETDDGDRAWLLAFSLWPVLFWRYYPSAWGITEDPLNGGIDAVLWTGRDRELIHWTWPFLFKSWQREMITGTWNDETADAA